VLADYDGHEDTVTVHSSTQSPHWTAPVILEALILGEDGLGLAGPSPKALRDLRRRLGAAPLQALFDVLAGPVAWPRIPGVMFGRYRTVAFDGCKTIKVRREKRWEFERR
jgi:hypothetical protein